MDVKELNKSQLILLAILLSFITSIATGITTVTLIEQAPKSVTVPINRIVKQTIEKVAPLQQEAILSEDQKKLLEELKAIKPLTVSLFLKGDIENKKEDKILGTGLFLGEDKVIIASLIDDPKEGEVYVVKSVLGEKKISKLTKQDDFTIVELVKDKIVVPEDTKSDSDTETKSNTNPTQTP